MRCLPGLQPVWKEDQATGDSAGSVVPSRAKAPISRSREKFGSKPAFIHFSVSSGSCPSSPTITTRLARAFFERFGRKNCFSTQRNGQVRSTTNADAIAANRTKKVETIVKPAPGPRYACAALGQKRSPTSKQTNHPLTPSALPQGGEGASSG